MIEWFGGKLHVVEILLPLFGLLVFLVLPKITDTNRSYRYFVTALCFWLSFELLIGLEEGTAVSFPHPAGLISAVILLLGFIAFMTRGFITVWKLREKGTH